VIALLAAAALFLLASPPAQDCQTRPKITGIAQVNVYSSNLKNSQKFYGKILGLAPATAPCRGSRLCYSVNGEQQVQVISVSKPAENFLAEVAFATENIGQMHCYLLAHKINASLIKTDSNGGQFFDLQDPEGHRIAFVQRATVKDFRAAPDQVSTRLFHAGFIVRDSAVEDRFYRALLGFRMYWHGGFKDTDTDWEELQVPDGSDWIEYMLNIPSTADHKERGVQNHFSLGTASAQKAVEMVRSRGLQNIDGPEVGRDGKSAADIYDPDATRVELMEFAPVTAPCCSPYAAPHPKP
jgi:catechol 2,3-dioxygenase-like lactoylglutathione lyase family enzyme